MNQVSQKIAQEIAAKGVISFARFMELSLYCPVYGYYERERDRIGARGDYFTSVSVGPLFGELLAFQFAAWLTESNPKPRSTSLRIVEAGAHDGRLAEDILSWLSKHRGDLFDQLEYCIIEPSTSRRQWQQRRLQAFGDRVRWIPRIQSLRPGAGSEGIRGVVFSNEFLDAWPVRRFGWDAEKRSWFEWGVTRTPQDFAWARMEGGVNDVEELWYRLTGPAAEGAKSNGQEAAQTTPPSSDLSAELASVLPDGFTIEICPGADSWWREAARALSWGFLMTVDYGWLTPDLLATERRNGTLRAYRAHRVSGDLLAHPGEQDLTAHVDFARLRSAGETEGLKTESLGSQAQFLVPLFARFLEHPGCAHAPDPKADRRQSLTRQFHTLTHPEHLGLPFRVLVQSRLTESETFS